MLLISLTHNRFAQMDFYILSACNPDQEVNYVLASTSVPTCLFGIAVLLLNVFKCW